MKTQIYTLIMMMMLASCETQRVGTVHYKMRFTTEELTANNSELAKITEAVPDDLYTQFGDYITSLTPTKFIAKIWTIGYIDTVMTQGTSDAQMLQYIDQNPDNLSQDDPSRIVDFSNNVTVTFENPVVFGRKRDGILSDQTIKFNYFYFMPYYLYQEVPLPAEYEHVQVLMFGEGYPATVENNVLKTQHQNFIRKIFPNSFNTTNAPYFYFGNTDSSFVVNPNGEGVLLSENNPAINEDSHGGTKALIIRSSQYTSTIYHAPAEGETLTMSGIVSFNTTDLIQVYAGADNVPYTHDDVFVYAPKFWERISVSLVSH